MQKLIDDLLAFSRLGRCAVSREPVALGPLVSEVIEELAPESQGRQVEWCVGDLPLLDADPGLMRVVLVNLLSNAVKFTRGRAPARIEVFSPPGSGSEPVIAVRDNGAGFAPKMASACLAYSNGCTRKPNLKVRGWAWPPSSESSPGTAGASGQKPNRAWAPRSSSRWARQPFEPADSLLRIALQTFPSGPMSSVMRHGGV